MPVHNPERTAADPIKRGLFIAITISIFICVILVSLTFLVLDTLSE